MSASQVEIAIKTAATNADHKVVHHWCCDPKVALCGHRIKTAWIDPVSERQPDDCLVCLDLIDNDVECSAGCNDRNGIAS